MNLKSATEAFGAIETPFYYYDMELLGQTLDELNHRRAKYGYVAHYAVKANDDPRILEAVRAAGLGVDCVSGGEVALALQAGFSPDKIVFAGVGKTDREIRLALEAGIGCFNCESIPEIEVIDALAGALGRRARIAVRVNPDIDAHTHKYISTGLEDNKFGISTWAFDTLAATLGRLQNTDFLGLHVHVGSQITDMGVFELEGRRTLELVDWFRSRNLAIDYLNVGGGLGVDYDDPDANPVPQFAGWMESIHRNLPLSGGQTLHFEPGRSIVAQCGSLISRVVFVKEGRTRKFAILDAGMNDLIRPALYGAHHKVQNLTCAGAETLYDVVGPVCESSDVWGVDLPLPVTKRGDLMAIRSAGAYGQVMAMDYNRRPRAKAVYSDQLK